MNITIQDEGRNVGFAITDDDGNHCDWNKMQQDEREKVLHLLALGYRFFYDHLHDDAPELKK